MGLLEHFFCVYSIVKSVSSIECKIGEEKWGFGYIWASQEKSVVLFLQNFISKCCSSTLVVRPSFLAFSLLIAPSPKICLGSLFLVFVFFKRGN